MGLATFTSFDAPSRAYHDDVWCNLVPMPLQSVSFPGSGNERAARACAAQVSERREVR